MTLIKRIEAGETGREIDVLAYSELGYTIAGGHFYKRASGVLLCKRVSTSLDAVMALKEEVLPDWQVYHANETVNIEGPMWSVGVTNRMGSDRLGFGTSMAAALLCAILKAKEANNG